MPTRTAKAAARMASCNDLLYAVDQLETLVGRLLDPVDGHVRIPRLSAIKVWIGDAREIVLDIKASL